MSIRSSNQFTSPTKIDRSKTYDYNKRSPSMFSYFISLVSSLKRKLTYPNVHPRTQPFKSKSFYNVIKHHQPFEILIKLHELHNLARAYILIFTSFHNANLFYNITVNVPLFKEQYTTLLSKTSIIQYNQNK